MKLSTSIIKVNLKIQNLRESENNVRHIAANIGHVRIENFRRAKCAHYFHCVMCHGGRDGASGRSANLLTGRYVVRIRPLLLDFPCLGLGNLAVSQPSCLPRVAWQLGTGRVLQLNDSTNRHEQGSSHLESWNIF
ncbi:hypothetical protein CSKR_109682 [Clonorchis sinensis]|uniref:Uncharacterized protein n=1 Tax=Clonorchis sinensis TaxID=79923 RepID=A0A3R7FKV6_CLOSI|nr:hypothetical protein CSKR_109682 [Clonorchis sinensis]